MLDLGDRISVYQPEQAGLKFPRELNTNDPEELRQHRKRHPVGACRAFAKWGLDFGFAGHLTIRDPEYPELYRTDPMAVHFAEVRLSNLILADHDGRVVEGDYAVNRAGFVLHAAVHAEHPDILAMCHAHTLYGSAYASQGRPLAPIAQDACQFFEDHAAIGEEAGQVSVERGAGASIAPAFKGVRAAIHQNHGLFTVSRHSIDAAAFMFLALERCCRQQLTVEASDREPIEIPAERARYSREHVGSDYTAWLCFQTDYDHLVRTDPDMFD